MNIYVCEHLNDSISADKTVNRSCCLIDEYSKKLSADPKSTVSGVY